MSKIGLWLFFLVLFSPYFSLGQVSHVAPALPPHKGTRIPNTHQVVNPYLYYSSPPAPSGIASFGIYNLSGKVTPYVITTPSMVGYANITSLLAYYKLAHKYGVNPYSATLQFNVVLYVNTTGGSYTYWLQDVGSFTTDTNSMSFIDNIWNLTGSSSTLNSNAVSGNGKVASAGGGQTFYYDIGPSYTYSFPFSYIYVVNVSYTTSYVTILFGYAILQNGKSAGPGIQYYDRVTIAQSGIRSASIMINGNMYTPDGLYFDAELVWGGGGNGAPTSFNSLESTLGMYYQTTSGLSPVPSLYTFGSDTGESAYNVHDYLSSGVPVSTVGTEDLTVLTNNFSAYLI